VSVNPPKPAVPQFWVLDANILFSTWSRWLCYVLAEHHGATLCWTPYIEEECFRNLVRLKRIHEQDSAVERAELLGALGARLLPPASEAYYPDVRFVDAKDRHVAASALGLSHIEAQPVAILTWNTKDFPRKALLKLGVVRYGLDDLVHDLDLPRELLLQLLNCSIERMQGFKDQFPSAYPTDYEMRARPLPVSVDEWVEFLSRCKMHQVSKKLFSEN
jgi:hypothetical protein